MASDKVQDYRFPPVLEKNEWALSGKWKVEGQRIVSDAQGAALRLNFIAGKVFLVLGAPKGKKVNINIKLNGNPNGKLTVSEQKLYELIDQGNIQQGELEITADAPNLEAYAFTFGN
jgi:hypothetical protein